MWDLDALGKAQERDIELTVADLVGKDVAAAREETDRHLWVVLVERSQHCWYVDGMADPARD